MPCGAYSSTPSPAELVPSPYKQGESAVRSKTPHGLLTTHYSLLSILYSLLTIFALPHQQSWSQLISLRSSSPYKQGESAMRGVCFATYSPFSVMHEV